MPSGSEWFPKDSWEIFKLSSKQINSVPGGKLLQCKVNQVLNSIAPKCLFLVIDPSWHRGLLVALRNEALETLFGSIIGRR